MKIRLIHNYDGHFRGDILTVQHDIGDSLIKLGIAMYEPDQNSIAKTIDEAPRDKMVRQGSTRRKSKVK